MNKSRPLRRRNRRKRNFLTTRDTKIQKTNSRQKLISNKNRRTKIKIPRRNLKVKIRYKMKSSYSQTSNKGNDLKKKGKPRRKG